jgi:hypothetical protein
MSSFESSVGILLSGKKHPGATVETIVAPLSSTESLVATRGLAVHLGMIYRKNEKKSGADNALLGIYSFLTKGVDNFRFQAMNVRNALDPSKEALAGHRFFAAAAIAHMLEGKHSHRTGVWLKGSHRDARVKQIYWDITQVDDMTFYEYQEWARKQAVKNEIFWRQQLDVVQDSTYGQQLIEAINQSDDQVVGV